MDEIRLSQRYKATTRRQFTCYHYVPRISSYSFDQPRKNERISQPWSFPKVSGPWTGEASALSAVPLAHIMLICT